MSEVHDIVITPRFLDDLGYWARKDRKAMKRLLMLMEAIRCDPRKGPGKPKPLRHAKAEFWSRRLTLEHRLVYQIEDGRVILHQARHHYE